MAATDTKTDVAPFEVAKGSPAQWKVPLLREFSTRGFWLLDSAKCAVNGLREGGKRNKAIRTCASGSPPASLRTPATVSGHRSSRTGTIGAENRVRGNVESLAYCPVEH